MESYTYTMPGHVLIRFDSISSKNENNPFTEPKKIEVSNGTIIKIPQFYYEYSQSPTLNIGDKVVYYEHYAAPLVDGDTIYYILPIKEILTYTTKN